jgi:Ca2+-binding RTX toxin-like protein
VIMATIQALGDGHLNMGPLDLCDFYSGRHYVETSKVFAIQYGNDLTEVFRGSGFKYDHDGTPIGGTVTSYAVLDGHTRLGVMYGLDIPIASIADAAATFSSTDDYKIIRVAFSGNDSMIGGQYSDTALGYDGNDRLSGHGGNDALRGGDGNDRLIGGAGRDSLFGNAGADVFVFNSVSESKHNAADKINDFSHGQHDRMDLSGIDAMETRGGNQNFRFIGEKEFHHRAGELSIDHRGGQTLVLGDTDGNGVADFELVLNGHQSLSRSDFAL